MRERVYDKAWARYGKRGEAGAFLDTLRTEMEHLGITKAQLSARAGFDPSQVSRWFKGRRAPDLESKMILDEAMDQLITAREGEL